MDIFQQVRKVRISDTVVDQILSILDEGVLKPGDYLPGERDLVRQLGVARSSVREALRMLEYQGIIEIQPGKGAFIVSDVRSADEEVVRRWFNDNAGEYLELIEIRESLEALSAQLAAQRATKESIESIRQVLIQCTKALELEDVPQLVELDHIFHQLVAKSSGNNLLSQLIDISVESLVGPRLSLFHIKERAKTSWHQHNEILYAIEAADPVIAERAMREHMASVRKAIIELKESNQID